MACFLNPIASGSLAATAGERRFGERLRTHLEDDYLCWHNVPVGPSRMYPDFVVLHPGRGLWVFEVKDWRLESVHAITKQTIERHQSSGALKTEVNPLEQARGYCLTIVNKLSTDPQLQDPSHRYRGKICFPYGYATVLTNITRAQLDAAMTPDEQEQVLPPRLVICKDEMTPGTPADVFQERLWGMFHYQFGRPLTLPQVERVRWHLFPEIRITSVQRELFEATPEQSLEEAVPDIVRVLDLQQEQLARSLGEGHRVIHGVAGSGKTLILGYRCLHLARMLHKPILVLCFNVTLSARLSAFAESRGIADKVQVYPFHEWCSTQLKTYHVDLVKSNRRPFERQVESVISGVEAGRIPRAQYGAVLIDEGHDFEPDWLQLVTQMVDPATDSLLLLYDDAQSIYRKKSALRFSLASVGIKAQGRTTILRLNYRNTREILRFAFDFATSFVQPNDSAGSDEIPLIHPEAAGSNGPMPVLRSLGSLDEEAHFAAACASKWIRNGVPPGEIAILYFRTQHGRTVSQKLSEHGVDHLFADKRSRKAAYDPAKPEVAVISVPSSKGLEFRYVIIVGIGHPLEATDEETARLLYVGMTRARQNLVLTASAETPFTERLAELAA